MNNYVLFDNETDKYVAIDQMSGGSPYFVYEIKDAKIWTSIPEATRYARTGNNDWSLYEVEMTVSRPVEMVSKEAIEHFEKMKRQGY